MEIQTVFENPESFKIFEGNSSVENILKNNANEDGNGGGFSSPAIFNAPILNNLSVLTEHLILSSASSVNPDILEALDIKCVINCAPELPDTPLNGENVIYHKVGIVDSGSSRILPFFDEAADLINKVASSGERTLVYCVAGVSRSASICIAYLMKHHQLTLLESFNYVKLRRPKIKPNCGFFKQLIEYEENLYGCNTVHMVFNEFVRMEIPDVYDCEYRFISSFVKKRKQNTIEQKIK